MRVRQRLKMVLSPCAYDPQWPLAESNKWIRRLEQRQEQYHPWGMAALVISGGDRIKGRQLLDHWLIHGIQQDQLGAIQEAPAQEFAWLSQELDAHDQANPLPAKLRLLSLGLETHDWHLHAWLHQLGLDQYTIVEEHTPIELTARNWPLVVVQFERIAPYTQGDEQIYQLFELAHAHTVYDVSVQRVELLRRLGINAKLLSADTAGAAPGGWLGHHSIEHAQTSFGLPNPAQLPIVGNTLCLGRSREQGWTNMIRPPLLALPEFDSIKPATPAEARGLASWILGALSQDLRLVRINPTDHEIRKRGFACLASAAGRRIHGFIDPIHPDELIAELEWREAGCQSPEDVPTPQPETRIQWSSEAKQTKAAATVCVSLYNYASTITRALDSVSSQDDVSIDLIVVDDQSTDGGDELVLKWMEINQRRFCRTLLMQHTRNSGLASARNTAFTHAQTEWCFVLDADNVLHPTAISQCLKLTTAADHNLAVVHPLIELSEGLGPQRLDKLLSAHSWQVRRFAQANHVDAMALVKRSAWEAVGGYQHFPNGWEDYDFWCSLIDHGYYGVVCPQILATYCAHEQSMLRTTTQRSIRSTSRRLQQRHPWLDLPTAKGMQEGEIQ
jgi:GT2 family glycosyltransferase